ncbi:MAG: CHAP domain-containing protein [Kiloniellaceae bacterium]
MRANVFLAGAALVVWLAGCSAATEVVAPALAQPPRTAQGPRIVSASTPLQCVPYARKVSGIAIRGDAWTWWRSAKGRYARGKRPKVGSVLVLKKTRRLRYGHLAVVKRILGDREIVVDQANWLNRGKIHLNTAVRDVSSNNDWSAVRVWYTPGRKYGARTYATYGFIYPGPRSARQAANSARDPGPTACTRTDPTGASRTCPGGAGAGPG